MSSLCERISRTCGELRSCYYGVCFYAIVLPTGKIAARRVPAWWRTDVTDWWDHYKQNFHLYFQRQVFEDFYNMQYAQELIVRRCVVSSSTTKPPNISSLGHRIVENWLGTFCQKIVQILACACSKFSSLCEKISQTCGELRTCYCGVCFYAIVLPTGKITAL